ncbi:MAG TPA: hypothetical protein VNO14_16450 [Blastocatellia bacterium]|nr:hypothetical protein [Blastocatellia bacterium]
MREAQRDRAAYRLAKEYLLKFGPDGVTEELLERYLRHPERGSRPDTIAELYRRILESAQGANMKAGVIGRAIGGVDRLGPALCRFQPGRIIKKYGTDWERVLDDIERRLRPEKGLRRTSRSIWPGYCRTILSAARFMSEFSTAEDFYEWADFFDKDDRARPALPMLLSCEIYGLGFALACDFLKELGYANYAKPDVHLRDIFEGLGLCQPKSSDYQLFKAVVRVAKNAGVTPYNVDKLFWLIGSGNFYNDPHIGASGRIGARKKQFIASAQELLGSDQR